MRWNFWKRHRADEDFADEIASHLAMEAERQEQRGVPPQEAAFAAERAFGNTGQARERFYESERAMFFDRLAQDVRYGLRTMARNRGFATVAILTIGLAIGLNAAVFAIFDAIALRPAELPGPTPVVALYQTVRGAQSRSILGSPTRFPWPDYLAYREQASTLSGVAAYVPEFPALLNQSAEIARAQLTSCNYFDVLQAQPTLGRGFTASECATEGDGAVAVLSYETWQHQYASSPAVLGTMVRVNRVPLTIVGVAPKGFHGPELVRPVLWAPLTMHWRLSGQPASGSLLQQRDMSWLVIIGRLADRASIAEVRAQVAVIAGRLDQAYAGRTTTIMVAAASAVGDPGVHSTVLAVGAVFLTAVGMVLLIACANVANLFLVRAAARRREIALRLATGASRGRLVRQLVTESLMIAAAGGAVGSVAAIIGARALVEWVLAQPGSTPLAVNVVPDVRVFVYALLLTVGTGLFFGLVPALQATRADLTRALKQEDHDPDAGRSWLRSGLLGVQVTACLTLLLTAGLMLRGLMRVNDNDPGYSTDHVTQLTFDLQREGYTAAAAQTFHQELTRRLSAIPGVDVVAEGATAPLGNHHSDAPFGLRGQAWLQFEFNKVGAGYFAAIGLPLARGRDFTAAEVAAGAKLVVVSEAAARRLWPGEDPVAKVLASYRGGEYFVTGVARDAEVSDFGKAHTSYLYFAAGPADALQLGTVLVHATLPASSAEAAIRAVVQTIDKDLHVSVRPLAANIQLYVQAGTALATLATSLGALALILAAIGIYGTVAYTVTRRTREIGIRMAIGARVADVIALVLRQAMWPVAIGAAVGTLLLAAVSRFLAPVLFGASPHDAVAFGGVLMFLGGVAALASYLPARRAARVDPTIALRSD